MARLGEKEKPTSEVERKAQLQEFCEDMERTGNRALDSIMDVVKWMWSISQLFTYILFGITSIQRYNEPTVHFRQLAKLVFWFASNKIDTVDRLYTVHKYDLCLCLPVPYYFKLTHQFSSGPSKRLRPDTNRCSTLRLSSEDPDLIIQINRKSVIPQELCSPQKTMSLNYSLLEDRHNNSKSMYWRDSSVSFGFNASHANDQTLFDNKRRRFQTPSVLYK